jgi:hypothetical protein
VRTLRLIAVLVGLVGLVIVTSEGGAAGRSPITLAKTYRSSAEGLVFRYPADWLLVVVNSGFVTNPALCFSLVPSSSYAVDVKVVEYLPPLLRRGDLARYQPRPRHFELDALKRSDADWTTGKVLSFRDHGRVFYVGVVMPATAPRSLRSTIRAILDSLQVRPSGRCAPSTGVGSATR